MHFVLLIIGQHKQHCGDIEAQTVFDASNNENFEQSYKIFAPCKTLPIIGNSMVLPWCFKSTPSRETWNHIRNFCGIFHVISCPTGSILSWLVIMPRRSFDQGLPGDDDATLPLFEVILVACYVEKGLSSNYNADLQYHQNVFHKVQLAGSLLWWWEAHFERKTWYYMFISFSSCWNPRHRPSEDTRKMMRVMMMMTCRRYYFIDNNRIWGSSWGLAILRSEMQRIYHHHHYH